MTSESVIMEGLYARAGLEPADAADVLATAYTDLADVVAGLDDDDFLAPTRCRGWVVADLLCHVLEDAQRALVALATPADRPADTDAVSYWLPRDDIADPHPLAHAWYVRRAAAAYRDPRTIGTRWAEVSSAAARALRGCSARAVSTQGRVLRLDDFAATLVFEACVHHLDLIVDLPSAAHPGRTTLALTAAALDGIAATRTGGDVVPPRPRGWDLETYVLKGAGRVPLEDEERAGLGKAALVYPVLR